MKKAVLLIFADFVDLIKTRNRKTVGLG